MESCAELKELLLSRGYKHGLITAAMKKALAISRTDALKKVVKPKNTGRPVFAVTFHPKLPSVSKIVGKHFRAMIDRDPELEESFPEPPLVAHRRPKSIRDLLIRSKLPPPRHNNIPRPQRDRRGMSNCGKQCAICDFITKTKTVKATANWQNCYYEC